MVHGFYLFYLTPHFTLVYFESNVGLKKRLKNGQIPAAGQRYALPLSFIFKGALTLADISTLTMIMTMTMRTIT